jgi:hypothetical protein
LVVIEIGGSWPSWVSREGGAAPNAIVEVQTAAEPAAQFAQRVAARLHTLAAERKSLRLAVIATGSDEEASLARSTLARAILRAMAPSRAGELVLAADRSHDGDHHELFALAGALCEALNGSQISVSVRFSERRPRSGMIRSVREPAATDAPPPEPRYAADASLAELRRR